MLNLGELGEVVDLIPACSIPHDDGEGSMCGQDLMSPSAPCMQSLTSVHHHHGCPDLAAPKPKWLSLE
jgi:hypothetical protein